MPSSNTMVPMKSIKGAFKSSDLNMHKRFDDDVSIANYQNLAEDNQHNQSNLQQCKSEEEKTKINQAFVIISQFFSQMINQPQKKVLAQAITDDSSSKAFLIKIFN